MLCFKPGILLFRIYLAQLETSHPSEPKDSNLPMLQALTNPVVSYLPATSNMLLINL